MLGVGRGDARTHCSSQMFAGREQSRAPDDLPGAVPESARDGRSSMGAPHRKPARDESTLRRYGSVADVAAQWDPLKFLDGIEDHEDRPNLKIAEALERVKPAEFESSFEWCKHLGRDRAKLLEVLTKAKVLEALAEGLGNQMLMLQDQAAATSVELNDKFRSDIDAFLEFGTRELFDKGLNDWIGTSLPQSTIS